MEQTLSSTNKYLKFIENFTKLKLDKNCLSDDISSTYTLSQVIHIQTIYPLYTSCDSLDELIQVGKSDKLNDTYIYHYTKKSNLIPIIYNQIIGLCAPDDFESDEVTLKNKDLIFRNKKCLIFTCDNLMNKELLIREYIFPMLEKEFKFKNKKIKKEFIEFFIQGILDNIYIVTYSDNIELLIKLNNLYTIIQNDLRDTALIIIDGINLLDMQKVEFNLEKETTSVRKFDIQFKKKRKSLLPPKTIINPKDTKNIPTSNNIITAILSTVSNLYKFYNFNLIITSFDYDAYSYSKFISSGKSLMYDIKNKVNIDLPEHHLQFCFKLPPLSKNVHSLYFIEPIYHCLSLPNEYFSILCFGEDLKYIFKVFAKEETSSKIKEIFCSTDFEDITVKVNSDLN